MQQLVGAQQRFFLPAERSLLIQPVRLIFLHFGALPQQDGCGQQVGAGAQQVGAAAGAQQVGAAAAGAQQLGAAAGAQAAGAAQVGAHAAGAAHVGAGAQQLGAGAQPQPLFLPNRPASALFRPAKHTSAAVIQANFISRLLNIQAERERDVIANDLPPDPLSSGLRRGPPQLSRSVTALTFRTASFALTRKDTSIS